MNLVVASAAGSSLFHLEGLLLGCCNSSVLAVESAVVAVAGADAGGTAEVAVGMDVDTGWVCAGTSVAVAACSTAGHSWDSSEPAVTVSGSRKAV